MQRRSVAAVPLLLLLISPFCIGDQWLMQGDFIPQAEASRQNLVLETTNSTTSVSSSMRLTLSSPPRHLINCVLAAALNMNGHVKLLDGGLGSSNVTLGYESIAGRPDLLFVQIESNTEDRVQLRDNVAENSRVTILYDKFRDWAALGAASAGNTDTSTDKPVGYDDNAAAAAAAGDSSNNNSNNNDLADGL